MTREEFATLLKNHDWGYQYSDDREMYRKGAESWERICAAVKSDIEFRVMLDQKLSRRMAA